MKVGNNPCRQYTARCDWECVFICKTLGTERYGECAEEERLEECDLCGAKILPPPYAPHECTEYIEDFMWDNWDDE